MTQSSNLINHVAIIMDGNGRWANRRAHRRIWGHIRGTNTVSQIVEEAQELNVKALTLYAFSTENWSRPLLEVQSLFKLLKKFILKERKRILREDICFRVIGDWSNLPNETQNIIIGLQEETKNNKGLKLSFAFGYGGRSEIVASINQLIQEKRQYPITEEVFANYLMASDVDLLIRTGGDKRISNFLLWQIAYAELFFTDTMWPDFTKEEFRGICQQVSGRSRRFGSIDESITLKKSQEIADSNKKIIKETLR